MLFLLTVSEGLVLIYLIFINSLINSGPRDCTECEFLSLHLELVYSYYYSFLLFNQFLLGHSTLMLSTTI